MSSAREYARKYYLENREKLAQASRDWRANNPDKYKETKKRNREKYKDKIREYNIEYIKNNRDELNRKKREVRKDPKVKERDRKSNKLWVENNIEHLRKKRKDAWNDPEKRASSHITVLKRKYPDCFLDDGSNEPEQLGLWIISSKEKSCRYCGSPAVSHIDHIKPLSKGGMHSWENIQMICKFCNIAKHNMFEDEFFKWVSSVHDTLEKSGKGI